MTYEFEIDDSIIAAKPKHALLAGIDCVWPTSRAPVRRGTLSATLSRSAHSFEFLCDL